MNRRLKTYRIVTEGYERLGNGSLVRNPKKSLSRRDLHRISLVHKSIHRHAREAIEEEFSAQFDA